MTAAAGRRLERMNELVKEAVALLLLHKSKDPRLKAVSVVSVKMTADLRKATVFYSHAGEEAEKKAAGEALSRAAGFVRAAVGENLGLKFAPEIRFEFDRNLEHARRMAEILNGLPRPAPDEDHVS